MIFELIPRKCFYLKAGNISKQKAYINKGCTRTFTLDEKEHEHIMFFSFEDWWIADFESYYTQQPAHASVRGTRNEKIKKSTLQQHTTPRFVVFNGN